MEYFAHLWETQNSLVWYYYFFIELVRYNDGKRAPKFDIIAKCRLIFKFKVAHLILATARIFSLDYWKSNNSSGNPSPYPSHSSS